MTMLRALLSQADIEHRKDLGQSKTVKTKETGNVMLGENRKEIQY